MSMLMIAGAGLILFLFVGFVVALVRDYRDHKTKI